MKRGGVFFDEFGLRFGWFVLAIVTALASTVAVITFVITAWVHYADSVDCHKQGTYYNRPVKFQDYGYWKWECLTQVGNQWLPVEQVRIVVTK